MRVSILALAAALTVTSPALAQSGSLANQTPTEVVVTGTPRPRPAPEAAPPPLSVFVAPPRVEDIALSADGTRIAFVTRVDGIRMLAIHNTADGHQQVVRLAESPITAISWLDNDHIILSDTLTGIRGTCPSGQDQRLKDGASQMNLHTILDPSKPESAANADAQARALGALHTPGCVQYGVRSQDAVTVVDLRTSTGATLGNKLSEFNNLALGVPKPVTIDGKTQLMGAFLEMRASSIAGQPTQRVYLWRTDPDTGIGKLINDDGGDLDRENRYVDDWLFDSSGQPLARTLYSFRNETYSIEQRIDGKWKPVLTRRINGHDRTFAPFLAGLGRDGQALLVLDAAADSPTGLRRFHYYELSADGRLSEALDPDDATRDHPIFHPETGALAGFGRDGETPGYTFFDPDLADYYQLAVDTAPGQSVRVAAMARDPRQMILFAQGGDDPGSWHYYDFANGKRVDIGSNHPAVPAEWIASQRSITYPARDGTEIHALLTLPPKGEAKNRALVVLPHDGPLGHDGHGFDEMAQALASRGYVVLQPNYRGSDGYGQPLIDAGQGQWSSGMLTDLSDGVRYLVSKGIADARRVCIAGAGYGGYAALASATASDGTYRCAAAIGGISDVGGYAGWVKGHGGLGEADPIAALQADPRQSRAFVADKNSFQLLRFYLGDGDRTAMSPLSHAGDVRIPVLLVRPANGDVPSDQTRRMRDALQAASKPVTYVEVDDKLTREAARLATLEALVAFLQANNPAN